MSKYITSKIFIFGMLILVQLIWVLLMMFFLSDISIYIDGFLRIISFLTLLYIINKDDDSGYKLIWSIVITIAPLFGGLMYLAVGNKRPSRQMRDSFQRQGRYVLTLNDRHSMPEGIDEDYKGQFSYLNRIGFPTYENTISKYYPLGDDNYEDLLADIQNARHFVFMEYFIVDKGYMFDTIASALIEKSLSGVEVRFMYDDFGSIGWGKKKLFKKMKDAGIRMVAFNPFVPFLSIAMNNRDHRKITVIDGTIGYSGGFNIADEYINRIVRFGHWKDAGIKIEGMATWSLTKMFLTTWNASKNTYEDFFLYHPGNYEQKNQSDGLIIPYGDSPLDNEPVGENVYLNLINNAKKYIYIFTPYLVLNETLYKALTLAVKRDVDVRIVTPGIPDKKLVYYVTRSFYENLIEGGVRIYEYTPGFIHSKNFIIDDKVAVVGTINLDYRSLFLHFECGVILYRSKTIATIKQDFDETFAKSQLITRKELDSFRFNKLAGFILRLFAPLL